jgi:hypothetical protein
MRLIEDNAISLRLKSDLERYFATAVDLFEVPPPLLGFCHRVGKQFVGSES